MPIQSCGRMEFHVSRYARDLYQFDQGLFSSSGNVIFANFHSARLFTQKMNQKRDLLRFPERAVRAGQINAMGLIDEILHLVIHLYKEQKKTDVMADALDWITGMYGKEGVDSSLREFAVDFPPLAVYRREMEIDEYLEGKTEGIPNRQILLEEMLVLWLANANPAFSIYNELFDDTDLGKRSAYPQIIPGLRAFFDSQPSFGPENQNLVDMLRSPAVAHPHSLTAQLEYIRQRWGHLLGKYLFRLLSSLDLISEEEKAIFLGPGPARVYDFRGLEAEPERFSPDKDWMPHLVLIAKNIYVWLDQLSRRYQRAIYHLDLIPDEELDTLARWGFTGLWLIGIWERSEASRRIKQMRGNPDAVSSAYSLYGYQIAADLGGESAFRNLRDRAWERGIRMASDMVPNHMGIDSQWVIEHPDWFIGLDYSPFPSYSFNGPDLSKDARVGIYLEDHYYDNSDAAVVFKRLDHWTGSNRFIYHGNDGTSMPWNDTAQLNYLLPEVREAVIQTILQVARMTPIIRFDAAMTLAKKHYQRLWFPEPGTGGAIPSRAEYGLTREQIDAAMPVEFWREVVDRVAQEVPDTLLLAEAFWLMEGYFVRTLGMHRVYNSAFMNMLRDEKNAEYRLVIKNTLEFDPEILKRYVNFMNNPDERTAVDQFGKGDKYFGICTLMATMPGLPMVGHGQIEGFTEKYGMEYRRAYWDETPDGYLVNRHIEQIFPLLRKRYLFAEVRDFLLYDCYSTDGYVNEDVFAYSNCSGDERSLVVYHNRFASTRGWIRSSAAFSIKSSATGERRLVQRTLGEGLGLMNDEDRYCIFRDHLTGLEYIRNNRQIHEQGLYIELDAYKCYVFLDFREVQEDQWRQYAQLSAYLDGRGVPDIQEVLKELFLQPIHYPFRELVNSGMFRWLIDNRANVTDQQSQTYQQVLDEVESKALTMLREVKRFNNASGNEVEIATSIRKEVKALLDLPIFDARYPMPGSRKYKGAIKFLTSLSDSHSPLLDGDPYVWSVLLAWIFTHSLGKITSPDTKVDEIASISRSWIDEWLLGKMISSAIQGLGLEQTIAWRAVETVKLLVSHQGWQRTDAKRKSRAYTILQTLVNDVDVQRFLSFNRYQGVLWFNKEAFDHLLWWMFVIASLETCVEAEAGGEPRTGQVTKDILAEYEVIKRLLEAEKASGYHVETLVEASRKS